uniref:Uncharacterized protein n=1 Tax=virus sp. ctBM815 TaxID=2825806 RepID=A0A8S5RL02_9VIRU|nr:MAG TPA: hypothetical protein [virus sp. ctBM815]DAV23990.1 MAG TPA: hypothetical protein [Bacteriophage sp.]
MVQLRYNVIFIQTGIVKKNKKILFYHTVFTIKILKMQLLLQMINNLY